MAIEDAIFANDLSLPRENKNVLSPMKTTKGFIYTESTHSSESDRRPKFFSVHLTPCETQMASHLQVFILLHVPKLLYRRHSGCFRRTGDRCCVLCFLNCSVEPKVTKGLINLILFEFFSSRFRLRITKFMEFTKSPS